MLPGSESRADTSVRDDHRAWEVDFCRPFRTGWGFGRVYHWIGGGVGDREAAEAGGLTQRVVGGCAEAAGCPEARTAFRRSTDQRANAPGPDNAIAADGSG